MRELPPEPDEIDAVLGDEILADDLSVVAAVVHDMRAEYLTAEKLDRDEALLAFTEPEPVAADDAATTATVTSLAGRTRRRGLQAAGLGIAGKILLGTTVAAASVGGLGAANVIDLPGLPDQAADQAVDVRPATIEPAAASPESTATSDPTTTTTESDDAIDADAEASPAAAEAPGAAVSEAAHAKEGQAADFVAAVDVWHACADELDVADRVEECGEVPHPADFGVTDPPGELARPDAAGPPDATGPPEDADRPEDAGADAAPQSVPADPPGPPADPGPPNDREVGRP